MRAFFWRFLRVAPAASGALLLASCYATNNYTLRLDAQAQSKSELCEQSSGDSKPTCAPLAGQTLEAPGVLAVEVVNTDAEKTYTVSLEQVARGTTGPTPDDVIQEVGSRLTGLSTGFVGTLENPVVSKQAAQDVLLKVSASIAPKRPAAGAASGAFRPWPERTRGRAQGETRGGRHSATLDRRGLGDLERARGQSRRVG